MESNKGVQQLYYITGFLSSSLLLCVQTFCQLLFNHVRLLERVNTVTAAFTQLTLFACEKCNIAKGI